MNHEKDRHRSCKSHCCVLHGRKYQIPDCEEGVMPPMIRKSGESALEAWREDLKYFFKKKQEAQATIIEMNRLIDETLGLMEKL